MPKRLTAEAWLLERACPSLVVPGRQKGINACRILVEPMGRVEEVVVDGLPVPEVLLAVLHPETVGLGLDLP